MNAQIALRGSQATDYFPVEVDDITGSMDQKFLFHHISAMPQFINFSQEELRVIDYRNDALRNNAPQKHVVNFPRPFEGVMSNRNIFVQPNKPNTPKYFTLPSIESLSNVPQNELLVKDFRILRPGIGEITYDQVNLAGLDLNQIAGDLVVIQPMRIHVNPQLKDTHSLHGAATITFENCFPTEMYSRDLVKDPSHPTSQAFHNYLQTHKRTEFISYNGHTGQWKFRVNRIGSL
ncbi:hypothetical protein CLU79DRAFT_718846 [Phycomyces nitens]|nr:hypothetical protein CLU79DRAFT_718846 [Phycomyces nitens]